MNYAELVSVKARILADGDAPLYQAETNVRLAKGLGWWVAAEDGDGVVVTEFMEGGGKRTLFFDHCTPDTLLDTPHNITTLASTVRDYCGSIDETCKLIRDWTKHTCSIEMSEDPSGAGAKLRWWPHGLSQIEEPLYAHCVHASMQLALLWCFLELVLKNHWYKKVHTQEEIVHEQVA